MSKWYEVKLMSTRVFAIEVEDDEDANNALDYAFSEVQDFDDADCSGPFTEPEAIDRIKHYADEVLSRQDSERFLKDKP